MVAIRHISLFIYRNALRPGHRPGPHGGSTQCSSDLAGLGGQLLVSEAQHHLTQLFHSKSTNTVKLHEYTNPFLTPDLIYLKCKKHLDVPVAFQTDTIF